MISLNKDRKIALLFFILFIGLAIYQAHRIDEYKIQLQAAKEIALEHAVAEKNLKTALEILVTTNKFPANKKTSDDLTLLDLNSKSLGNEIYLLRRVQSIAQREGESERLLRDYKVIEASLILPRKE